MAILKLTRTLAAAALVFPSFSSAAIVNIHQTIDLTTLDLDATFVQETYKAPLSLAVGDTLKLTYDFAGNRTLKMYNPISIIGAVWAGDGECTNYQATGTLNFVSPRGPAQSATETERSGCVHFGVAFDAWRFASVPGPIEFSGLNVSLTVDEYDNRTSRDYTGLWFYLLADRFEIGREVPAEVPEPASLPLLGFGLAALATSRKRRPHAQ